MNRRDKGWGGKAQSLSACAEGCYKHKINGKWVCCKCGS